MRRNSLLIALALLGGCPDKPNDCPCEDRTFAFEVSGIGEGMVLYDQDGNEIDTVDVDVTDCACADRVKLRFTHRQGTKFDPPPEEDCVLSAPDRRAATMDLVLSVGDDCDFPWFAIDSQPPVPIPIKVRP